MKSFNWINSINANLIYLQYVIINRWNMLFIFNTTNNTTDALNERIKCKALVEGSNRMNPE